ncbi:MAG: iron-containing alcohol dehydrogenase [Treponema bryantii]|nr:iron-containing alcohol dehydrogenase [Treponema bryantii]
MGDFAFRITPNIILGSYTLSRLPQQVMEWGTRFMIIADPVLNEFGTIQKITQSFTDRKIEHFVFSEISEGNTSQLAKRALALAKEGHVHGIIAIGGSKALNIGRIVAAFFNEVHDFNNFVDGALPTTSPIPCICVPTIFSTPFIFTNEIPIKDSRNNQLKLMKVQNNLCKLVLVDPNLMLTLTQNQKSTIAIEVMSMAIEAYLSQKSNFFSDMFVEKGLELLAYALDGSPSLDITTPEEILLAQAGIMISLASASSSLGLSSLLAMTINSRYQINKSLVSSILLSYSLEDAANFKSVQIEKLSHIMRVVPKEITGPEAVKMFIDNIRQRIAKANLPTRLKDLQLSMEQLSLVAEDAGQIDIITKLPRSMSTDDIFDFIKNAY